MRQANDLQFERWATRDKKQWFCIFAFGISIRFPFFRVSNLLAFSGISRIYKFIYISLHTHTKTRSHLWCCCWIATNSIKYSNFHEHQLDIRFEFHIKQLVHSIRIRRNANARKPNAFWYTHTHILCQSVIDKCSGCHVSLFSLFNWNAIKLMCQFSTHSFSNVPSKSWMVKPLFKSFQWDCKTIVSNEPKRNHKIEFGIVTFQCSRFSTALYRQ